MKQRLKAILAVLGLLCIAAGPLVIQPPLSVRPKALATTTFFVQTTGNDTNTCLASGVSTACATIQGAINKVYATDLGGTQAVVQVADGTYTTGTIVSGPLPGASNIFGPIVIQGNMVTPANVLISTTNANAFQAMWGAKITVQGMKCQTTTSGTCFEAFQGGNITVNTPFDFGATATMHMEAQQWGYIAATGAYTISGGATAHMHAPQGGMINVSSTTVTLTGTPAFSAFFAGVAGSGEIHAPGATYSGAATGQRWLIHADGTIFMGNVGCPATFFPGSIAGVTEDLTFGNCDYVNQTLMPTLAANNQFTGNMGIGVGSGVGFPLQIRLGTDVLERFYTGGSDTRVEGTNLAQNAFVPILLSGSTSALAVNAAAVLTASATAVTSTQPIKLPNYIVSGLPTCNAGFRGAEAYVTDALTPTFLVAVTGGGAVVSPVFCNGTNWVTF